MNARGGRESRHGGPSYGERNDKETAGDKERKVIKKTAGEEIWAPKLACKSALAPKQALTGQWTGVA